MRTPRHVIALLLLVLLASGCTTASPSEPVESPVRHSEPPPAPTTAAPTVPPVDKALLQEAITVYREISSVQQKANFAGGFAVDRTPAEYPKYLMGGALMSAVGYSTYLHQEKLRRKSGTQTLQHIQHYPVMVAGSLVSLSGCLEQTDLFIAGEDGWGYRGQSTVEFVHFKRDSDGGLKIFDWDSSPVETCTKVAADPGLVKQAAAIHDTVMRLFAQHLSAGGLNQAHYPTSGFGPYLGTDARNGLLRDLELARTTWDMTVTGPFKPGRVTVWPYQYESSEVALTSCFDRSPMHFTNPTGGSSRGTPRIYFAYYKKDSAGVLRLEWLNSVSVDACQ